MSTGKRRILSRRWPQGQKPVESLLEAIRGRGNVLIVTHDNPDPDAIASAHALRVLLREKLGVKPLAVFGGIVGRAENSAMLSSLDIDMPPISQVDVSAYGTIAIVDTQPGAGNYSLPPDRRPDVVVDHHPPRPETRQARFYDIRPVYGATSVILAEYLWQADVPIRPALATALLFGIKTETQDLVRMTRRIDFETYLRLYSLANVRLLAEIQRPKLPPTYFRDLCDGLQQATIHGRVAICTLYSPASPDMAAELADFLLRLEGVAWSICFGFCAGQLYVSVRTAEPGANAGEVVRKVVGTQGSAGGHDVMAGARIPTLPGEREERDRLEDRLKSDFLRELGAAGETVRRLLPQE